MRKPTKKCPWHSGFGRPCKVPEMVEFRKTNVGQQVPSCCPSSIDVRQVCAIRDLSEKAQRLAALVEGLRELEGRLHDCRDADCLSALLLAHGFALSADVPREAAQDGLTGLAAAE